MNRIVHIVAAAAALLLASLGSAASQDRDTSPMQPMGEMMAPGKPMPMMGGPMGMMRMAEHVEGRIAYLKAELKITEAQMPQWNAFADALRSNAASMKGMPPAMMPGGMMAQDGASMTAPDRLDRMEKMMQAMLEAVKTTKAALVPLYAVLTGEQKKAADQLIHGPMGMGPM